MTSDIRDSVPTEIDFEFGKLYALNGVVIIGDWIDTDNPTKAYTITAYRDEQHYRDFIQKMRTNQIYNQYSSLLKQHTESVTNINLEFTPMMKLNFDAVLMENYIQKVKEVLSK